MKPSNLFMSLQETVSPYIAVRNSGIHGCGIFAKKFIPKGARIIEYVGEKITKAEADKRAVPMIKRYKNDSSHGAVYLFDLNKSHDLDGNVSYNTARFINHSCEPNAETEIIRGKIWVIALRDIQEGEELFYNYGYSMDNFKDHPCQCGTKRCVGYILSEDLWAELKMKLLTGKKKENDRKR